MSSILQLCCNFGHFNIQTKNMNYGTCELVNIEVILNCKFGKMISLDKYKTITYY